MARLEKVLYTAKAHTTGGGDGASRSDDGRLDVKLSSPGTPATGTNPEQLFAAGWSACFIPVRRVLREPGSRQHRDPQLSLAAEPGRRRSTVRPSGKTARRRSSHRGAHDHP